MNVRVRRSAFVTVSAALVTSCAVFVFALGSTSHALATSGTADPDVQLYMDEFSLTRIDAAQQVSDRERLSPAIEAVYAHPDDFAGAYVTHEGGLTVHILYAAGEELARQTVQGAVGASGQVDYAPAKYSLASLRLAVEDRGPCRCFRGSGNTSRCGEQGHREQPPRGRSRWIGCHRIANRRAVRRASLDFRVETTRANVMHLAVELHAVARWDPDPSR